MTYTCTLIFWYVKKYECIIAAATTTVEEVNHSHRVIVFLPVSSLLVYAVTWVSSILVKHTFSIKVNTTSFSGIMTKPGCLLSSQFVDMKPHTLVGISSSHSANLCKPSIDFFDRVLFKTTIFLLDSMESLGV